MAFDPRCVAFEGRLHADRCTAEYVGRASHDSDAACFRSIHAVTGNTRSQMLRMSYFETQIRATSRAPIAVPVRTNTSTISVQNRRHPAVPDQETLARINQNQRQSEEVRAMNMEDVPIPATNEAPMEIPVNLNGSVNSRRRSRIRLQRRNENKKFNHTIAVGFLLDAAEPKVAASGINSSSFTNFSTSSEFLEAQVSRRAIKALMQRVLPNVATRDQAPEVEEERAKRREKKKSKETYPAILHQDLGDSVNSVAYVGKTGHVISHGRKFLQCERYGTGDVVGCGVLFDTNTFFFTLNGKLMGMLAARDVYDLDNFGQADDELEEDESDEDDLESGGENEMDSGVEAENAVRTQLDKSDDDMEHVDGRCENVKVLFPSVSLHGVGECVCAVFGPDEFQFDLSGFEQQIRKKRQRALLDEREVRSQNGCPSDVEQSLCKDEVAMNELVQDFFLHYGYESAYKAFESTLVSPNRQCLASDGMEVDYSGEAETSAGFEDVSSFGDAEGKGTIANMDIRDAQQSLQSLKKKMRESLSLRHEVCEHIRCFRTARALAVLEQHVPALMIIATAYRSRRFRKLMLDCRILCVIDVLTYDEEAKATHFTPSVTNGAPHLLRSSNLKEVECNGWNPELAIEFARQTFASSVEITTNGKRKRLGIGGKTQEKRVDRQDVALAMSLLLFDQRSSIPETSHARKFLTSEFRELVADQLNSFLLMGDNYAKAVPRVSALETFMTDLESLQNECLSGGYRVYPESVEVTSNGTPKSRWKASVSSSSDDSSSSQSEQDDHFDDDDNDDE